MDGAVPGDRRVVTEALADVVERTAAAALRVDAEDFLRQRSVRLERGPDDPDAGYRAWYDTAALRREVLDPLAPGASQRWLPTLWDAARDRATRAPRELAPPGAVLVLGGPHLLREELDGALDVVVHLQTSPAAITRRTSEADRTRVLGAWALYLGEARPHWRAGVVVRCEDPAHPALVLRAPASLSP